MNFNLTKIPQRTIHPRLSGITVVSDKGLSMADTRNLLSIGSPYIDRVKLAFGTALVTPLLKEKIALYQSYDIPVYFGGILLEAFIIRNQLEDYIKLVKDFGISCVEVSDGNIDISHREKCDLISRFSRTGTVISEIGSKDKDRVLVTPPYKWIQLMQAELDAGAVYVTAEAKEAGNEGLYRNSGEVREGLVQELLLKIPAEKILWEAPAKDQQLYFIKLLGCNANLGNISPSEIIALETMRIGLRGDSFEFFLDEKEHG